ncbi:hypothetical protein SAMN05444678_12015 [Sphingomonas sp. YR710]|nr:hypothetical protein SAMN05444678_12015 [Sphingomonas sp. YR710]
MMLNTVGLLLIGIALGSGTALPAQTPSGKGEDLSDQIITGAWGDPAKCNSSNAKPVAFMDAALGNGIAKGECVSITAYWAGRAIFVSTADANVRKATVTAGLTGRRVGIYADERTLIKTPRRPKPFKIIGTYASCATEWPGAMMVLGYCHFSDGPFLKISQVLPAKRRDIR